MQICGQNSHNGTISQFAVAYHSTQWENTATGTDIDFVYPHISRVAFFIC